MKKKTETRRKQQIRFSIIKIIEKFVSVFETLRRTARIIATDTKLTLLNTRIESETSNSNL